MKTILVPIDFTAASDNALVYANKLAARLPAEIVLVQGGCGDELTPSSVRPGCSGSKHWSSACALKNWTVRAEAALSIPTTWPPMPWLTCCPRR
ncbi:universal stress protein [Hymenobacter humi]|uniref:Universal stress protein n=1 Tax=Hymenobacter humi TaxID=1411620 RepID=A0ABW2UFW0_9BACT